IDWGDEKKAEQEALERLGYAKIDLSETTRAFVIQSARAGSLTLQRERLLTSQLADAHFRLSKLPDQDDYEQQRNQIAAEITEMELTSGHTPTHEQLAAALGISVERLETLLHIPTITSLSYYMRAEYANDGYSFLSLEEEALKISEQDWIDEYLNDAYMKEDIDKMMA